MKRETVKGSGNEVAATREATQFPFSAIVGQEEMKLALLLCVVEPSVGGVLITGHRGTAKSTAVRALAELLPPLTRVTGCAYNCDPDDSATLCDECRARLSTLTRLPRERARVPVTDLPLNATEDRLCGTLNVERALRDGARAFEPGLLARAHRGFLYIDEVNLLEDHLVDLLLDVSAAGRNRVEREGVSADHAARFVLVGSSNPEEGELRPQLLDRFGLCVEVRTSDRLDDRAEIVTRREAFERDPAAFRAAYEGAEATLRRRLTRARGAARGVRVAPELVRGVAGLCARLGVDGHRGELTIVRAARALAALEGRREATTADVRRVSPSALRHRLRTDPLEDSEGGARVERGLEETFGSESRTNGEGKSANGKNRGGGGEEGGDAARVSRGASRNGGRDGQGSGARNSGARDEDQLAPPTEATLNFDLSASESRGGRKKIAFDARAKARTGGRAAFAARGRFVRAAVEPGESPRVAVAATLRAAALKRPAQSVTAVRRVEPSDNAAGKIAADDLRYKRFSRKEGTLFIFAVDASGSMAVNRIRQAKGALAGLLRSSYVNRDRVALVSFRGEGAELLLRPSQSAALAKRRLDALPVGGSTPLAAGLHRSLEVARSAVRRGAGRVELLVFTDGRANVSLRAGSVGREGIADEIARLGGALRKLGVSSSVVDTRRGFGGAAEGESLAATLGGRYLRLPVTGEGDLTV